jgi:hypothetical protein
MDIKNYYFDTHLGWYEYVRNPFTMVPDEILEEYNLYYMVHIIDLYVEVRKGMYGLPQAGLLTNLILTKRLTESGYSPVPHTHG